MDSPAPKGAAPGDFGTGAGDDEQFFAIVSASQLTGDQLETIVAVLKENAPNRVDWNALLLSLVSAGITGASICSKKNPETLDAVALTIVIVVTILLVAHTIKRLLDKDDHYERALRYARAHAEAELRRAKELVQRKTGQ